MLATKRSGIGGIGSARCLPARSGGVGSKLCDRAGGDGIWMRHALGLDPGVFVKINGQTYYLWRAVDHEGKVLESVVTKTRDRRAALKLLLKLLRRYGSPEQIVTDKLRSYGAAMRDISLNAVSHETEGRWINNRADNSHLPFRRRAAMLRCR